MLHLKEWMVPSTDLLNARFTVTILFAVPTRALRAWLFPLNPLNGKCGTPEITQLKVGLKVVQEALAIGPPTLLRAKLIVTPVVTPVTGQLAVPSVKVEEWSMCGPILTTQQLNEHGLNVNRIP